MNHKSAVGSVHRSILLEACHCRCSSERSAVRHHPVLEQQLEPPEKSDRGPAAAGVRMINIRRVAQK